MSDGWALGGMLLMTPWSLLKSGRCMNGVSGEGRNLHVWNTLWAYQACLPNPSPLWRRWLFIFLKIVKLLTENYIPKLCTGQIKLSHKLLGMVVLHNVDGKPNSISATYALCWKEYKWCRQRVICNASCFKAIQKVFSWHCLTFAVAFESENVILKVMATYMWLSVFRLYYWFELRLLILRYLARNRQQTVSICLSHHEVLLLFQICSLEGTLHNQG